MDVFVKYEDRATPGQIPYEVAGLRWLAEPGVCQVVEVLASDEKSLTEPRLRAVPATARAARTLGGELALLHAAGAAGWGAPPPGHTGSGWMGRAPLSLPSATGSWGRFYAQERIRPYLRGFGDRDRAVIEQFCALLETGALDHPGPRLAPRFARTHGDLWSGNLLWTEAGATLIDPAAQGGHAEEDLAALAVFGAPYLEEIIAGYQQVSPLAEGWRQRVHLHQMHILMVHAYLFGGGYVPQCVEVATEYLRGAR